MKFKPNKVFAALLSTTLITGLSVDANAADNAKGKKLPEYDPSSIIVKFKSNVGKDNRKQLSKSFGASFKDKNNDGVDDRYRHIAKGRLAQLKLPKGADPKTYVEQLKHNADVEYAELNYILKPLATPNDTRYGELWGMHKTKADLAWDMGVGDKSIVVGVIDTGIDYTHPDLAGNMWVNPNEIPGNNLDDDGNGYIDDVHGISAINDNGDPMDTGEHGTHVAGTVGATGNNGEGVVGVNWQTDMVGCSFLGQNGGTLADGVECINYMVDLKNRGTNVRVLNNSWGGGGFSQTMKDAITAANNADMIFVAAAGNSARDNDITDNFPSNYDVPNVLAIASTTINDDMSSFSQWGATTVDMGAPGSSILSTLPGNRYGIFSGTSMATPHVAGAAALILAANPSLTTAQVKEILMTSGDPIPALDGLTVSGRRLNVENAMNMAGGGGPTYYLGSTPYSNTVNQGQVAIYNLTLNAVAGYNGTATMTASASPVLDGFISFSPSQVGPGGTTAMTVDTNSSAAPGNYTITVTAEDGSLSKSTDVTLKVMPAGTLTNNYSNNQAVAIPDNNATGVSSTITVADDITITNVVTNVNIDHTYIGDLIVSLTSPAGTTEIMHERAGGNTDNIVASFDMSKFEFENAQGDWILNVSDNAGADTGTLNNWSIDVTGSFNGEFDFLPSITVNSPNNGSSFLVNEPVTFDAQATDPEDGDVSSSISWNSSIDGLIGHGPTVTTSSLSAGTHQITVSATDSAGQTQEQTFDVSVVASNTTVSYSNTTPLSFENSTETSIINATDGLVIDNFEVSVDIQFDWIGDLRVKLTSPAGTSVILHNFEGYSDTNLVKTYMPVEFVGESSYGEWSLEVMDSSSFDNNAVLNSWVISMSNGDIVTPPANEAPAVSITSPTGGSNYVEGDAVTFSANASDAEDGDLSNNITWISSLDGVIGSGSSFTTSVLSAGTHNITAQVNDSQSVSGSAQVGIVVNAAPVNEAPLADFNFVANHLNVQFTDASGDIDGSVVTWNWDFGDGISSSLASPAHSYAAPGTYSVSLTVTDDQGATHSVNKSVSVTAAINLSASATTRNGKVTADLTWSGGKTSKVDVYRDGVKVREASNNGSYTDRFNSNATSFTYQVCEQGSTICSVVITIEPTEEQKRGKGKSLGNDK
ncbi:S8 family serine peptidase [Kangiella marina]|uniref:Peptidase S8 n=1 Tax=Kangiella marina TaxID=1079178 RepID=A0ABP8ID61_9GAMM